ncbi:MAG: GNAT family N-acetyltransferase [Bryobacteraceae bacterium]
MSLSIDPAHHSDAALILEFIRKLAAYEKLSHEVVATEDGLVRWLFGRNAVAEAIIARWHGRPVGFAIFFTTFSTFNGCPGLYLEDVFVDPEHRGKGIGKGILRHLAQITVTRGYRRLEWSVLNWNEPSIRFYESLGAKPKDDWTVYRLDGDALAQLAE